MTSEIKELKVFILRLEPQVEIEVKLLDQELKHVFVH
jgi:hypothetical protein